MYSTSDPEQVTSLTNVSNGTPYATYTYDESGNQLTRSYPATNELWEYTYDGKDQLRRVVYKLGGALQGSEEYWYGADGNRTQVVKRDAGGNKTELIWCLDETEAHYDGAGNMIKTYAHVSLGTPIARIERTTNGSTATMTTEFQFHGLASNTIAAVAQNGTINASFRYAPFGEVLEATNAGGAGQGTGVHKRRFNDKYEDDIGALTYYGARYYDKVLLGWTQADPLYLRAPELASRSTPRRSQVFLFALNNPNRYFDPDGLDSGSEPGLHSCTPFQGGFQIAMAKHSQGAVRNLVDASADKLIQGGNDYIAAKQKEREEAALASAEASRHSTEESIIGWVVSRMIAGPFASFLLALDDGGQTHPATAPDDPVDPGDLLGRQASRGKSSSGVRASNKVHYQDLGGEGERIGVISVGGSQGTRAIAGGRELVRTESHADLGALAWGKRGAGERRFGLSWTSEGPMVHFSSTGSVPHPNDIPEVGRAVRAMGVSGPVAVQMQGGGMIWLR